MKNWKKSIITIAGVLLGNLLLAFTVAAFVVPYGIVMGGATGIGLTISHYVPVSLSTIIFAVNIILFWWEHLYWGKRLHLRRLSVLSYIRYFFLSYRQYLELTA